MTDPRRVDAPGPPDAGPHGAESRGGEPRGAEPSGAGTDLTVDAAPAAGAGRDDTGLGSGDPAVTATVGDPQGWRRLSARMLAVHPIQELRRYLVPLVVVFLVGRGGGDRDGYWPLIGFGVVVALGVTRWLTTTYRVTPTQVQVRRGLLRRETLSVPRDRVRTVDMTANLMHRLLGLARLSIGTGQNDRKKGDLRLDALSAAAAARLRSELLHERGRVPGAVPDRVPAPPPERVLATLRPAWVRYAPFTLSGLVTIGVFAGFLANLVNQAHLDPTKVGAVRSAGHELSRMSAAGAVLVVLLAVVVVVAVLSAGGYILQYWQLRLSRRGDTLHVSRGLLTTRETTIEERRLRGAEISEPLLLRWVGGARCVAITTGLRVGRGAERGGSILMPAAPAAEVTRVATEVLSTSAPVAVALVRHGPVARRRRFTRAFLAAALVTLLGAILWYVLGWSVWFPLVAALMFPAGVYLAIDRYRNLGHALTPEHLVARQGSAIRRRIMLERDGIIGWVERQSFFQRRVRLVTLRATTAAGRGAYAILDITPAEAVAVADAATPGLLEPFLTSVGAGASGP